MDAIAEVFKGGWLFLWGILAAACLAGGICSIDRAVTRAIHKSRRSSDKNRRNASWPWK